MPPPALVEQYNAIHPGASEIFFTAWEEQRHHRMKLETHVVRANTRNETLGMILGFLLAIGAIGGGVFLIYNDKDASGLATIGTAIAGLATAFIVGRRKSAKELHEKDPDNG